MAMCAYTNDKNLFGMSYGHFSGLVEDICEYLHEHFTSEEDDKAICALEYYKTDGKYVISKEDCKRLFNMMTEDETCDLRFHIHNLYTYDYEYPVKRLMNICSEYVREWDKWVGTASGSMTKLDFDKLKALNYPVRSNDFEGVDYFVPKICFENTPIDISFEEPLGGAEDGALESIIIAMAHGAMSEDGLHIC